MAKKKAKRKAEPEGDKAPSRPNIGKDIDDIFAERKPSVRPSAQGEDDGVSRVSATAIAQTSTDVAAAIETKVKAAKASSKSTYPHPMKKDDFSDLRGTKKRMPLRASRLTK
jgi:hypothetical protein